MTKARDLANASTALSAVSATELGYVDGVTSAIQTQLDGKQAVNANVSTTELGYLDGVTSAIQTQLDAKAPSSTAATLTGTQTLTNKTLTSPALTTPTISTATTNGDILYGTGSGALARLGIGTTGQVLKVTSGLPSWGTSTEAYAGTWTQAATGSLTGASVTVSGLSGKRIAFFLKDFSGTLDGPASVQINGLTSYYYYPTGRYSATYITLTSYITATDGVEYYTGAVIDMAGSSMAYKPITVQMDPSGNASYAYGGWYGSDPNPVTSLTFDINGSWDAGTYFVYQEN
jgi:hypothetical protein